MLLKDWISKNKVNICRMSEDLNFHPSFIYRIIKGERTPGKEVAVKIESYTNGEVSRNELMWPEDFEEDNNGVSQFKMDLNKMGGKTKKCLNGR